jgi:hypothetical protein
MKILCHFFLYCPIDKMMCRIIQDRVTQCSTKSTAMAVLPHCTVKEDFNRIKVQYRKLLKLYLTTILEQRGEFYICTLQFA